jgi:hypothetical protein
MCKTDDYLIIRQLFIAFIFQQFTQHCLSLEVNSFLFLNLILRSVISYVIRNNLFSTSQSFVNLYEKQFLFHYYSVYVRFRQTLKTNDLNICI